MYENGKPKTLKFYQQTGQGQRETEAALFWWSEELTDEQRAEIMRTFKPLMAFCRGLGEVGVAELAWKLARFVDEHEEGIE